MTTTRGQRCPREKQFGAWLGLADSIADGFSRRGFGCIEREDARQVARMALWLALGRLEDPISAGAYLSRCIRGELLHHARDLGRAIRVPARAQQRGGHGIPWVLESLDWPAPGCDEPLSATIAAAAADTQGLDIDDLGEGTADAVMAALEGLPADQAAVLRLRYGQGLSLRAVGAQLGFSAMAACRRERSALATLRDAAR